MKNLDMDKEEFKKYGSQSLDWINEYFENIESYPVIPNIKQGDIAKQIPETAPFEGEPFDKIFDDFKNIIVPGITHWNHPYFMALFNSTVTGPGIIGELLSAALNANGFLWMTSPALTELEERTTKWFAGMIGLPKSFWGIIYDSASTSTMHAIACAREQALSNFDYRHKGVCGNKDVPVLRVYCSEYAHSSVEKGAMVLGIGLNNVIKIKTNERYEINVEDLENKIKEDIKKSYLPAFVCATVGTTSITSIDNVNAVGDISKKYNLWFHVDGAYGGSAAILDEMKYILKGIEKADSIVVNPHKWLFTPVDISLFYTQKPNVLKNAFTLIPEYLKTDQISNNLMDYGFQLGRRFRSLKFWFTIRYFGINGLRKIIKEHIRLAKIFEKFIDNEEIFEKCAPVPFSTVCFRLKDKNKSKEELNILSEKLINELNASGKIYLAHTKLGSKYVVRFVISGFRQEECHILNAMNMIKEKGLQLLQK